MQDDILKLVVELTNLIGEEINGSEKIARLMDEFERRGLQAGVDIHPVVRNIAKGPAPSANIQDPNAAEPAPPLLFSDFDIGFLKAMRILPQPSEMATENPPPDG